MLSIWTSLKYCRLVKSKGVIFNLEVLSGDINPLPHMPILDSSKSATNKDMVSKYEQMGIQLPD